MDSGWQPARKEISDRELQRRESSANNQNGFESEFSSESLDKSQSSQHLDFGSMKELSLPGLLTYKTVRYTDAVFSC